MSGDALERALEARAPGAWEIYRKEGISFESGRAGSERVESRRRENGCAARWWDPAPRFAAAGSTEALAAIVSAGPPPPAVAADVPEWPAGTAAATAPAAVAPPPDLAEELARLVAAESRGEATLVGVSLRRGATLERVTNAKGLDVAWRSEATTGVAEAVGRRGARTCESRALFRWERPEDLTRIARRLSDRATLPLTDRRTPIEKGEWLLDPAITASLLAGLAPLFTRPAPRWAVRGAILSPELSVVDDAASDAPFDGEGSRSRRVVLIAYGAKKGPLLDLVAARAAGGSSTGHGVRHSYRTPPVVSPRRLFFESERPVPQREMLASVRRGLFAAALTAPLVCDVENDRYEAEFTGVSVVAGRAQGPVAGARSRGRLSELLRRITALAPEREFLPVPFPAGGAAMLVERAAFD